MIEITKEEFYKIMGPIDVCVFPVGEYPYTSEYRMRGSGILKGKCVESYTGKYTYPTVSRYYVSEDLIKLNEVSNI